MTEEQQTIVASKAPGEEARTEEEEMEMCEEILGKLKKSTQAAPFLYPVDPVRLNIPDYYAKITSPMDLSTIKKKLDSREYKSLDEFKADVELMLANCYTYNQPDSTVYKMGAGLEKYFKQLTQKQSMERLLQNRRQKKRRGEDPLEKRHREDEPEKRRAKAAGKISEEENTLCMEVLTELLKPKYRKSSWPFLEPVDAAFVPDYYTTIKSPMDLSTIRKKIAGQAYNSFDEFVSDFNLMISNCYTFNVPESEVYQCAKRLSACFLSILEQKKKVEGGGKIKTPEPTDASGIDARIAEVREIISQHEAELRRLEIARGEVSTGFSYEEKKKLKRRIECLPMEKLKIVVSFIQKNVPGVTVHDSEDVEVDLDRLDFPVLSKLSDVVREIQIEGRGIDSDSSSD